MQNSLDAAEIKHTIFDISCNMLFNESSKDAVMTFWTLASVAFFPLLSQYLLPIAVNFSTLLHAVICLWQVVLTNGRLKLICYRWYTTSLVSDKIPPEIFFWFNWSSDFDHFQWNVSFLEHCSMLVPCGIILDYPGSQFISCKFQNSKTTKCVKTFAA